MTSAHLSGARFDGAESRLARNTLWGKVESRLSLRNALSAVTIGLVIVVAVPAYGQDAGGNRRGLTGLPEGDVFRPLLADPKTPRFDTSVLRASSDLRTTTVWAVVFGENIGLARWDLRRGQFQVGMGGAVFAQFDLDTPSTDLINADYVVGVPFTFRSGALSSQVRVYHQSSHLGDEFLVHDRPQRINLSFESLEWLVSYDRAGWRVYGGGEYMLHRVPSDLQPRMAQFGAEHRQVTPFLRLGDVAVGRVVAALDVQWWEQHGWGPAWSAKAGLEFDPVTAGAEPARHWDLLVQYFSGPSPYGQFYAYEIKYLGAGVQFAF